MTRTRRMTTALGVVWLAACTAPNPAYWNVTSPDAEGVEQPPILPDASPFSDDAEAALDLPPPADPDVAAPPLDAGAADLLPADLGPARDLGPDAFVAPAGCGLGAVDVSTVKNADGVVVDDDGTVYVLTDDATHSYVGRLRMGQPPDLTWRRIDNSPVTWGLALDRARKRIYVLVVSGVGALVAFDDINGAATGRQVLTGIDNPNDLVVAADGNVYYSSQGDRTVYRVGPNGGARAVVSTTPFGDAALDQIPSAVTMDPAGNLIVGLEPSGQIYRVTLANGMQTSRTPVGTWNGWANGLTYDRSGRLYIGIYDDTQPRTVVRLEPDGRTTTIASNGRFSSIDFGRGPLDCRDLYVTDPFGAMRRVRVNDAF